MMQQIPGFCAAQRLARVFGCGITLLSIEIYSRQRLGCILKFESVIFLKSGCNRRFHHYELILQDFCFL
jgi:hypothetical protein